MKTINSDLCHLALVKEAPRKLRFVPGCDYEAWRGQVKEKFRALLGMERIEANICDLNVDVEEEVQMDGYRRIRFTFETEKNCLVPCYLLVPDDAGEKKYPVAITLQGHSTGFHNSVGIPKFEGDEEYQTRGQFGVQAVRAGFVSLCIEQRGMGESISPFRAGKKVAHRCSVTALTAINLGRCVIGERVWDVKRGIDALKEFEHLGLDLDKILITGNSGGGTTTFYASCYDERIRLSVPSCAFCSYETSIMAVPHCVCNYIPGVMDWFEMEDLSCLIAPRPFTVVAGQLDNIFPIHGVRKSYETVQEIYKAAGAPDACRLVETPREHWWCQDIVWPAIKEATEKMGW